MERKGLVQRSASRRALSSPRRQASARKAQEPWCCPKVSFAFDLTNLVETKFARDAAKKPAVPKKDEKPIMGLVSDKNYIVANAVENILAAPKLPVNKDKDYLKKKNYGNCPKYLQKIKNEIEDEY